MDNKELEQIKEAYIEQLTEMMKSLGSLPPCITIFAEAKEKNEKPAIIHMPIPSEYMESEKGKDEFVEKILPQVGCDLKKDFNAVAVCWASEAWMRVTDKNNTNIKDWRNIPIKHEVIIITIEDVNGEEGMIYKIKRDGLKVDEKGDLKPIIELELLENTTKPDSMAGRFSGLLKNFKD